MEIELALTTEEISLLSIVIKDVLELKIYTSQKEAQIKELGEFFNELSEN